MSLDKAARAREIAALEELLARFGADRTRWPAPERLRFAGLIAESAEARRLLAEAKALDRLMDIAASPDDVADSHARDSARADRIAEAAEKLPQDAGLAAPPVMMPASRSGRSRPAQGAAPSRWPSLALLAACLAAGVMIGSSRWVEAELAPLLEAVEPQETEQASLWLDDDPPLEEDML